jgi:hypothetical protein
MRDSESEPATEAASSLASAPKRTAREAVRLQLRDAGYDPIPVDGKEPRLAAWQTLTSTTHDTIKSWTKRTRETNSGVLTQKTPTFDIDIPVDAPADAIERLVRDCYADCGVLLTRFGKAPKRAIPFRTDKPFKKITASLTAPDGKVHRLEFLGDGQQFVAHGVHPDTRRPYTWQGGELWAVGRDRLPCIDEAAARQLVDDAIELLVVEHGYTLKEKSSSTPRSEAPPRSEQIDRLVGARERSYAEATLRGRADELAVMHEGDGRNAKLLDAAIRLGTMVAADWIDASLVEDTLVKGALATGLGRMGEQSWVACRETVQRGFGYAREYAAPSLEDADAAAEAAMASWGGAANEEAFCNEMYGKADAEKGTAKDDGTKAKDDGTKAKADDAKANDDDDAKANNDDDAKAKANDGTKKANGHDAGADGGAARSSATEARRLIKTSAEFIASLRPPDYIIKGVLQRRFVYSLTAPTGGGKTSLAMRLAAHVAFGLPLVERQVKQGNVLFFAGENPDDIRMRWIKLAEEMGLDVNTSRICWIDARVPLSKKELRQRIAAEVAQLGEVALAIVDTSAAYFEGRDENDNVQAGDHARNMRSLVDLPGGPTVLVTCHPVKNPDLENLVPRGGGAFVNEVDGNLVCLSKGGGIVEVHWHVKFRGPDFAPIPFKIRPGQSEKLKDSDGDLMWTVTATPVTAAEQQAVEDQAARRQGELLTAMAAAPGGSLNELAQRAGWFNQKAEPNKTLVQRTLQDLKNKGLAKKEGDTWLLTKAGAAKAKELVERAEREMERSPY